MFGLLAVALLSVLASSAFAPPAARPTISGEAREGETLTSSSAGDTGVYKWQRCNPDTSTCGDNTDRTDPNYVDIPGANGPDERSYTLTGADVGMMIRVQAKGTSLGEQFVPSAPVGPVLAAPSPPPPPPPPGGVAPPDCSAPTISGDATEGKTVTAIPHCESSEPLTFAFSWERCDDSGCAAIGGANEQSYNPTSDDVGKSLRVLVTATNSDGSDSEFSAQTGVVAVEPPVLRESGVVDPFCPIEVKVPGSGEFETLDQITNVPVGTKIDVSDCDTELITVRNETGKTQSAEFFGGEFKFKQKQKGKPRVILQLTGKFGKGVPSLGAGLASAAGGPLALSAGFRGWCLRHRSQCRSCKRTLGKRKCRRLWARGSCLCTTSGTYASGTVRGSFWYLQDGPGYTLAKALKKKLRVKDKVLKKKILLKPKQKYLATKKKRR